MKRVVGILSMLVILVSFVFAASSDVDFNFVVNEGYKESLNYIPNHSFFDSYVGYFVLIIAVLGFTYFIVKTKGVSKKKRKGTKAIKKKKVSKKKK